MAYLLQTNHSVCCSVVKRCCRTQYYAAVHVHTHSVIRLRLSWLNKKPAQRGDFSFSLAGWGNSITGLKLATSRFFCTAFRDRFHTYGAACRSRLLEAILLALCSRSAAVLHIQTPSSLVRRGTGICYLLIQQPFTLLTPSRITWAPQWCLTVVFNYTVYPAGNAANLAAVC